MVAGVGSKIIKFVFFTFNLLFCLCGAIIVALAVWLRFDNEFQNILGKLTKESGITTYDLEQFFTDFQQDTYIVLYIIMGIGAFMFITGFLGCCGAWCESVCLLGLFFSVVLTLFCVQIAGAIYIYVERKTFQDRASDWYQKIVDKRDDPNVGKDVKKLVDGLNKQFKCCDAKGCDDASVQASASCDCISQDTRAGCPERFIDKIVQHWKIAAIVAGSILLIELLAMIFACCLCSSVRSSGDYDYYY